MTLCPCCVQLLSAWHLQELAATCILRGWGAVLRLVLPQVATACTAQAAVAGIEQHLCGIPLLHAAGK